jgi:hypothetical protein
VVCPCRRRRRHPAFARDDWQNIEVKRRSEATVQAQFCLAVSVSGLWGREIHEIELDGLADLVGELPRQEHTRNMRLDDLNVLNRRGICTGLQ